MAASKLWREENHEKALEATRKWRAANPEHTKAYSRKYREANREKLAKAKRAWDHENRAHVVEYRRAYCLCHKEQTAQTHRRWFEMHPQKRALYEQIRRARKRANGGSFTLRELNDLFAQQEGFCAYCGELLYRRFDSEVHVEHRIPVSRGGNSDINNIALACSKCNLAKGILTDEEFADAEEEKQKLQEGQDGER